MTEALSSSKSLVPVTVGELHSSLLSLYLQIREFCCRLRSMADASDDDLRKEKDKMLQEVYYKGATCTCTLVKVLLKLVGLFSVDLQYLPGLFGNPTLQFLLGVQNQVWSIQVCSRPDTADLLPDNCETSL